LVAFPPPPVTIRQRGSTYVELLRSPRRYNLNPFYRLAMDDKYQNEGVFGTALRKFLLCSPISCFITKTIQLLYKKLIKRRSAKLLSYSRYVPQLPLK
jgi:hypothetical protein